MRQKPCDILAELDLHWIPQSVQEDVADLLSDTKSRAHDVLLIAREMVQDDPGVGHGIQRLRHRVLTAVAHALGRRGALEWKKIMDADNPALTFQQLKGLGVSASHTASPQILHREFGPEALHAVRKEFGANGHFQEWWNENENRVQQENNVKNNEDFKVLTNRVSRCKTPEKMKELISELGLPGDCWRSDDWLSAVWADQRKSMTNSFTLFCNVIKNDPRFTDITFHGWMQGQKWPDPVLKHVTLPTNFPKNWLQKLEQDLKILMYSGRERHIRESIIKKLEFGSLDGLDPEDAEIFFPFSEKSPSNPWIIICNTAKCDEILNGVSSDMTKNVMDLITSACKQLGPSACEMIDWCDLPEDFLRLFHALQIAESQWREAAWMTAQDPDLHTALCLRFGSHEQFVSWMDGRASLQTTLSQQVRACASEQDLRLLAKQYGIDDDRWKGEAWMLTRSSQEIGSDLSVFVHALENHPHLALFSACEGNTYAEIMRHMSRGFSHTEQAWDVLFHYCEKLGLSEEQLLRIEHEKLFLHYPDLKAALEYLEENAQS